MTLFQRIKEILNAILMILAAVSFYLLPSAEQALLVILIIFSLGLTVDAIKEIAYYFSMARHMIGGKIILFQGVVLLDFALFTASLTNIRKTYALLYLIGAYAFSGAVEILRAMEAKRTVDGPWKMKLIHGFIDLLIALLCLVFIRDTELAVFIYCVGLVYSAILRIIIAFRKTAFVLIE